MDFYGIIMEEDVLQIVYAIKAKHKNQSKFEQMVDGIKKMNERVKRDANSVAHGLAKEPIKYIIDNVQVEEILNYICGIIIQG